MFRISFIIIATLFVALFLGSLWRFPPLPIEERHIPSGYKEVFFENEPFPEHIARIQKDIRIVREAYNRPVDDWVIERNSPYEWIPDPGQCGENVNALPGALLVHGLLDSPDDLRDIGAFLLEQCYWVRAILLPGHGTIPGDLLSIDIEDWEAALDYGVASFKGEVDHLLLVGYSLGGALVLDYLIRHPEAMESGWINKIVLSSPALKLYDWRAFMSGGYHLVTHFDNRRNWYEVYPDSTPTRYYSMTYKSIFDTYRVGRRVDQYFDDERLKPDFFMIGTDSDIVISTEENIKFFEKHASAKSRFVLFSNQDRHFIDPRIVVFDSRDLLNNIIGGSHVSLNISPNNPYFGKDSNYRFCWQYLPEVDKLNRCLNSTHVKFGELNLGFGDEIVARVSYNPHFDELLEQLKLFLKDT